MFCPKCKTEYKDGFLECSDCMIDLISELPLEPVMDIEYANLVDIKTCEYRHEADLAKGLLLVYDIDSVIQTGTSVLASETPVRLLVKERDVREAEEILHNVAEDF